MTTVITLRDGTKCYSGPTCRRHGTGRISDSTLSSFAELTPVEKDLAKENAHAAGGFLATPSNVLLAEEMVEKANRKLDRLESSGSSITERFVLTKTPTLVKDDESGKIIELVELKLDKPSLGTREWQFEAVHNFTPSGEYTSFFADQDSPSRKENRTVYPICEHCNSNRHRGKVYWVRNKENVLKQVGSGCLKAFMGVKATDVWALEFELPERELEAKNEHLNKSSDLTIYSREKLLLAALEVSDGGKNFVSKAQSDQEHVSTAAEALAHLDSDLSENDSTAETNHAADLAKVKEWALSAQDDDGDYRRNLKAVLNDPWIRTKHVSLAVSAIGVWKREEEKKSKQEAAQLEARQNPNRKNHFAPIGSKISDVTAKVKLKRIYGNDFGTTTVLVFESGDGHIFKWNASNSPNVSEGDVVEFTGGTVKNHDWYQDTAQTILTRAKIKILD